MKNKEKYAKEIIEIACKGHRFVIDKNTNAVADCCSTQCTTCLFSEMDDCEEARRQWAESEYIEKPVISKKDRAFLEYVDKELKYIERDKNGNLTAYEHVGKKNEDGLLFGPSAIKSFSRLNVQFPMIKWPDDEAWSIEDLKKLVVVEEYENV